MSKKRNKTSYQPKWEAEFPWIKKGNDENSAQCKWCNTQFSVAGSGKPQAVSHTRSDKHKQFEQQMSKQTTISKGFSLLVKQSGEPTMCVKMQALRAELYKVEYNISFNSAQDDAERFKKVSQVTQRLKIIVAALPKHRI